MSSRTIFCPLSFQIILLVSNGITFFAERFKALPLIIDVCIDSPKLIIGTRGLSSVYTVISKLRCAISKLVSNFAISNLRSAISKLRKFANCAEQIQIRLTFQSCRGHYDYPSLKCWRRMEFSLTNKSKTRSRSSPTLDRSLSSLITVKTHVKNLLEWKPPVNALLSAKEATKRYNDQHRK